MVTASSPPESAMARLARSTASRLICAGRPMPFSISLGRTHMLYTNDMKILLSDGSGLTARQVAGRLSESAHVVEVLSPDKLCLCRLPRHVRRVHRVPSYGAAPLARLHAAPALDRAGGL